MKIYPVLGTPEQLLTIRMDDIPADDLVSFVYGPVEIWVAGSNVQCCSFGTDFKDSVEGVKIGDTVADVVRVLGTDYTTGVNSNIYKLPKLGARIYVCWTDDKKTVDHINVWAN